MQKSYGLKHSATLFPHLIIYIRAVVLSAEYAGVPFRQMAPGRGSFLVDVCIHFCEDILAGR